MNTTTKQPHTPTTPHGTIPKDWKRVAGMLKGRKEDMFEHVRKGREEWEERSKELDALWEQVRKRRNIS